MVRRAPGLAGVVFAAAMAVLPRPVRACTAFLLERGGTRAVGKSYDWQMGQGLVLVNKQGVRKRALTLRADDAPATWVSRHASVTFNQYGREFPNGGMNDAGVVVEVLWLDGSTNEPRDARPALNELQWIQYQLDNFASVAEMTAAAPRLRVARAYAAVHYLACDRTGACAAFEHLGGKLRITAGARALANHTYAESIDWAAHHPEPPQGLGSLERFARASRAAAAPGTADAVPAAFQVLDGVSGRATQWNIVYEPTSLRVHFRTRVSRQIKTIDFGKLPRQCSSAVELADIDVEQGGDITGRLAPYDENANSRLVERSLHPIAKTLPPGAAPLLSRYPSTLACGAAP